MKHVLSSGALDELASEGESRTQRQGRRDSLLNSATTTTTTTSYTSPLSQQQQHVVYPQQQQQQQQLLSPTPPPAAAHRRGSNKVSFRHQSPPHHLSLEEGDMPSPHIIHHQVQQQRGGGVVGMDHNYHGSGSGNVNNMVVPPPVVPATVHAAHHHQHHHQTKHQRKLKLQQQQQQYLLLSSSRIFDDPAVTMGYASIPLLEQVELPRGGVTVDTQSVGYIQFGIPPETIKDSMLLGMDVPRVYIVPTERFCGDLGPALGINLAEFEFPAYFNWFVRKKKCCLIVDSVDAEKNIRNVFEETLLGPKKFRDHSCPLSNDEQDFDPDFPIQARPNFYKEFQYFRVAERTNEFNELTTDMLLDFYHFTKVTSRTTTSEVVVHDDDDDGRGGGGGGAENAYPMSSSSSSLAVSNVNESIGIPPVLSPEVVVQVVAEQQQPPDNKDDDLALIDIFPEMHHHRKDKDSYHTAAASSGGSLSMIDNLHHRSTGMLQVPTLEGSVSLSGSAAVAHMGGTASAAAMSSLQQQHKSAHNNIATTRLEAATGHDSTHHRHHHLRDHHHGILHSQSAVRPASPKGASRRTSLESAESRFSTASHNTMDSMKSADNGSKKEQQPWMFSQIQWLGEVATVWPMDATTEQIQQRSVPRAEIFKMPGSGTEYVIHDVNADNIIIGKARIRGAVRVPDEIAVEGFLSSTGNIDPLVPTGVVVDNNNNNAVSNSGDVDESASTLENSTRDESAGGPVVAREAEPAMPTPVPRSLSKALFHPPSFGVTVLGNSHGFDKNGSTSGYVLWINGRGIMIDPPPYSSATLEREGIRPQMIFGVMITHCHADHDAGAFQKVLTGSKMSVITTPSIYTSFIRKYSALSGLSPTLLKHSHRFRRAIIGTPLKFQGATFHFTYTLHTIPCISFKVEWRGRSMVFTGDHLNLPPLLDELEQKGVLSKARADSLRQMPLQECDALLHEAGAPPIHTPLHVLQALPEKIKERLYVVHTSALPADSGLRVAPTGTAGTIRLDEVPKASCAIDTDYGNASLTLNPWSRNGSSGDQQEVVNPPSVMLRPSCISDAWFMLNLISNIPFFGNLSYSNTMEVLEVASIDVFSESEVVIPARKRQQTLCVIWEGTCIERAAEYGDSETGGGSDPPMWHAGDWTGPIALQPDSEKAARSFTNESPMDIVALSSEGVKVITLPMNDLHKILMRGSKQYRKYMDVGNKAAPSQSSRVSSESEDDSQRDPLNLPNKASRHVLHTLKINSVFRDMHAQQLRALESIAECERSFEPGTFLWKAGGSCDFVFLISLGTAVFRPAPGRTRSVGFGSTAQSSSTQHVYDAEDGRVIEVDKMLFDLPPESEFARLDILMALRSERMASDPDYRAPEHGEITAEQKSSDRNANKVFARLFSSKKCIDGLVVSRGCFLADIAKMVAGDLVRETGGSSAQHVHSTTLVAGPSGCVAWVFPRAAFMPFLDANPGVLLSLLRSQVFL